MTMQRGPRIRMAMGMVTALLWDVTGCHGPWVRVLRLRVVREVGMLC
jgi:hypothetical protein